MLQQFLHIFITSAICMVWGLPIYFYLKGREIENYWNCNGQGIFVFLFFGGLLSLAFLSSWAILFIPLKFNYLLSTTIGLIIILLLFFKKAILKLLQDCKFKKNTPFLQFLFILSCILLFTLLGTLKPVNIDTQLYHLQIIRWTNEYGTVPGLANLYPRLGLGSNWFGLISLFHIPSFKHQNFTFLNSTITIWFLFWLMNKWKYHNLLRLHDSHHRVFALFYFFLILYFLYDWQLFRDTANSTSYDFIVTALMIVVISYIAEHLFTNAKNNFSFLLIVISVMIITFKLSGIFILIPVFFYLLNFKKQGIWIKTFIAGCVILFPVLVKNYIVTGYPLYPSVVSFDSPEWQLPKEMAVKFQEYILYVNKFYNQQIGFIFSYNKTTFNWIPFWNDGILLKHKILFCLSGLSLLSFFYYPFPSAVSHSKIKLFTLSLCLMAAGWFFTAPDPRFAFGFLLFMALFPLSFYISKYFDLLKIAKPAFAILTLAVLAYSLKKSEIFFKAPQYLYTVESIDTPPFQPTIINNSSFNSTQPINDNWNNRCFFTPLPCLCEINPYLRYRSNNLEDGFFMNLKPDSNFIINFNY